MFLHVAFRARSLKGSVGCSLERGWLPRCRRQGGIHGKLWSAGGRELSAAPSISLAACSCVLEKTRWEDWLMQGIEVENSGLAGDHTVPREDAHWMC